MRSNYEEQVDGSPTTMRMGNEHGKGIDIPHTQVVLESPAHSRRMMGLAQWTPCDPNKPSAPPQPQEELPCQVASIESY